jgi:hypothetical protein
LIGRVLVIAVMKTEAKRRAEALGSFVYGIGEGNKSGFSRIALIKEVGYKYPIG